MAKQLSLYIFTVLAAVGIQLASNYFLPYMFYGFFGMVFIGSATFLFFILQTLRWIHRSLEKRQAEWLVRSKIVLSFLLIFSPLPLHLLALSLSHGWIRPWENPVIAIILLFMASGFLMNQDARTTKIKRA